MHSHQFVLDQFATIAVYHKLKERYHNEISFLFESADNSEGNYSFIMIGARERLQYKDSSTLYTDANGTKKALEQTPFEFLQSYYRSIDKEPYKRVQKELNIGYSDGFIGYIGYDMAQVFEPILKQDMSRLPTDIDMPDMDLILPKLVVIYSHRDHKITLLSKLDVFYSHFNEIEELLKKDYSYVPLQQATFSGDAAFSMTKEDFFNHVATAKEYIRSGDVFQLLLSNRYTQHGSFDPFSFYRILRTTNPSPYMYLLHFENFDIVGSSPEVMVRLQDNEILLRPIAGTRRRGATKERDLELENELLHDPKELAEHLMLIDLGRNDVGRVAKPGTVNVVDMMHIERYSHVMHIVSDVEAAIKDEYDMFDLLSATFTAGTMTGAPKVRAMQIIAELEQQKRNFYSGCIGYFGFDGNMDSAITIRTAYLDESRIVLHAGAGIVADSQPELEYLEVQNKLGALISTLETLKKDSN